MDTLDPYERLARVLVKHVDIAPTPITLSELRRRLPARDRARFVRAYAFAIRAGWLALNGDTPCPGTVAPPPYQAAQRGNLVAEIRAELDA